MPNLNVLAAIPHRNTNPTGFSGSAQSGCNADLGARSITMTRSGKIMALLGLALGAVSTPVLAQDQSRWRKLMEEAFNHRYRWNESLKGFSAEFTLTNEGKTTRGSIKADLGKPHGGVKVTGDDEQVKKLVQDTVASTVTHTRAASFEQGFGSCGFSIVGEGVHGRHQDRTLRPWFLQRFHRQGRQHRGKPRRAR